MPDAVHTCFTWNCHGGTTFFILSLFLIKETLSFKEFHNNATSEPQTGIGSTLVSDIMDLYSVTWLAMLDSQEPRLDNLAASA